MKLLTEPEVAEVLRCAAQKVKRLRLSGKLPYLPGRPVLIDEEDLLAFVESCKRRGVGDPRPSSIPDVLPGEGDDARKWALEQLTKRARRKPQPRGSKT